MRDLLTRDPAIRQTIDAARTEADDLRHGEVRPFGGSIVTVKRLVAANLDQATLVQHGAPTVQLPSTTDADAGRSVTIHNDTATGTATIVPSGGGTIDGAATKTISRSRATALILCVGKDKWVTVGGQAQGGYRYQPHIVSLDDDQTSSTLWALIRSDRFVRDTVDKVTNWRVFIGLWATGLYSPMGDAKVEIDGCTEGLIEDFTDSTETLYFVDVAQPDYNATEIVDVDFSLKINHNQNLAHIGLTEIHGCIPDA